MDLDTVTGETRKMEALQTTCDNLTDNRNSIKDLTWIIANQINKFINMDKVANRIETSEIISQVLNKVTNQKGDQNSQTETESDSIYASIMKQISDPIGEFKA